MRLNVACVNVAAKAIIQSRRLLYRCNNSSPIEVVLVIRNVNATVNHPLMPITLNTRRCNWVEHVARMVRFVVLFPLFELLLLPLNDKTE